MAEYTSEQIKKFTNTDLKDPVRLGLWWRQEMMPTMRGQGGVSFDGHDFMFAKGGSHLEERFEEIGRRRETFDDIQTMIVTEMNAIS